MQVTLYRRLAALPLCRCTACAGTASHWPPRATGAEAAMRDYSRDLQLTKWGSVVTLDGTILKMPAADGSEAKKPDASTNVRFALQKRRPQ